MNKVIQIEVSPERKSLNPDNFEEVGVSSKRSFQEEISPSEKALYLAKFCAENEKFEDAIIFSDEMIQKKDTEMTDEERDVFVVSYRMYISKLRSSWRLLFYKEGQKKKIKFGGYPVNLIQLEMRKNIEEKIFKVCEKFISIVQQYLTNNFISNDGKCFFLKSIADNYRYLAEISEAERFEKYKMMTEKFYKEAKKMSKDLQPSNAIRLGVCLNFAVFRFEILDETEKAVESSKKCLELALNEIRTFDNEQLQDYKMKESMAIIEVISMNIKEWTASENKEENESKN